MHIPTLNIPIQSETTKTFIKEGDTIPEILFEFGVGDNINLTDSIIKLQLYSGTQKVFDVTSVGSAGITILGEKSFKINEVPKDQNTLPVGILVGDLEITNSEGKRFTYFNVNYTISKQYTK